MPLTGQARLRELILLVLADSPGGKAKRGEVLRAMDARFGAHWTPDDRVPPRTRPHEANWMNRASFERAAMVRAGLLQSGGGGYWALTEEGKRAANAQQ